MSGHSKWSSIKHQKGATDAKRGKLFTKLTREIILSVREGGSSQDTNYQDHDHQLYQCKSSFCIHNRSPFINAGTTTVSII